LPVRTAATEEDLAVLEAWYAHLDDMASLHTIELLIEAIAGLPIAIAVAAHNPLQAAPGRAGAGERRRDRPGPAVHHGLAVRGADRLRLPGHLGGRPARERPRTRARPA
jgi:hypothetical protein